MDDGELRAILNTLVQGQTELRAELTGLGTVTAGMRTEMTDLRTQVTGLRTETTDVRAEMTDLRTQVTGLRTEMIDVRTGMTDLRTETTGLRTETTDLRTEVTGLRTEMTGLRTVMMDRFERIEDKLTSLQDDVSVNMMAVSHQQRLRTSEREASDQLTALVLKMEQQILRLQTDVDELRKAS